MRRLAPLLRDLARHRDGVAATEAALVLPFLLFLGGGVLEFGVMQYRLQLVEAGVRDAARFLARTPDPAAMEVQAKLLAVTGAVVPGGAPRVRDWTTAQVTVTYRTTANARAATGLRPYRGGDTVDVVRVATSVPYAGIGFLTLIRLTGLTLGAVHEERVVGG
ncbi:TadE/TadG family type IV pilus assembly protein [Salinarimonas soli]|uniref:Pilus assembly protein n=1 Tax=Salinarimonas soli TaxID=1638099 RepID=A0A5B2V9M4_9HYPH|nr:TadE/TadG family type IV pilus assembly protein [Salinarimonas soli]KAA2234947.1 pilus assembly protein [Salinarimonas soli]